jgi:hypothetical protein
MNAHRRNPMRLGCRDQMFEPGLNRRMGEPVQRIHAKAGVGQRLDLRDGLAIHLAAAQMGAVILQPVEPVALQSGQFGIQNGVSEIPCVLWRGAAAGQRIPDQRTGVLGGE